MSGTSVMLQKKLQELESELADVFRQPLDPTDPRREIPFDDVLQRFSFLSRLLSAEVESQPQTSDQLQEIDQRLTQLKTAFYNWNRSRSRAFDDTLSICSDCTQALLYDDDDNVAVVESAGSPASEDFSGEEKCLEGGAEKDEIKEERMWSKMRDYGGVFGCGMMVGAITVCMVAKLFFSSDHLMIEYEAFLLPPT